MGSIPAPAAVTLTPQLVLDRLKHTILNVSEAVADIERLDAAPSPDSLSPGETAAVVLLRGELLTSIKERLSELQEASPSLARMARGEIPSHREVDRAFLTSVTSKLDALEAATGTLLGLAAFGATQSNLRGEVVK
jgi:hypothetical protein